MNVGHVKLTPKAFKLFSCIIWSLVVFKLMWEKGTWERFTSTGN